MTTILIEKLKDRVVIYTDSQDSDQVSNLSELHQNKVVKVLPFNGGMIAVGGCVMCMGLLKTFLRDNTPESNEYQLTEFLVKFYKYLKQNDVLELGLGKGEYEVHLAFCFKHNIFLADSGLAVTPIDRVTGIGTGANDALVAYRANGGEAMAAMQIAIAIDLYSSLPIQLYEVT